MALRLASTHEVHPGRLNSASWAVVSKPGRSPEAYRLALRQAREASRLAPENGLILNTLGVAEYRAGAYEQALETLRRCDGMSSARTPGGEPTDVAFLAMTLERLGREEEARRMLERLRKLMRRPEWSASHEKVGFLGEAEALIERGEGE